jgi:hypothetical protein
MLAQDNLLVKSYLVETKAPKRCQSGVKATPKRRESGAKAAPASRESDTNTVLELVHKIY